MNFGYISGLYKWSLKPLENDLCYHRYSKHENLGSYITTAASHPLRWQLCNAPYKEDGFIIIWLGYNMSGLNICYDTARASHISESVPSSVPEKACSYTSSKCFTKMHCDSLLNIVIKTPYSPLCSFPVQEQFFTRSRLACKERKNSSSKLLQ